MAKIIAITNTKGGVGKTTTALNLSAALAERGCRVLAVDLDPQASLTVSLGERPDAIVHSIDRSLSSYAAPLGPAVVKTREGFSLVPARHELTDVEKGIEQEPGRLSTLQRVLRPVAAEYDYILLDCPANAGVLTGAALVAASEVIVPLTPDYLSLRAFDWLWKIVQRIRGSWNPGLHVMGVLLNMYDPRTRHARGIVDLLAANYRSEVAVFSTVIRNSVRLKESAQANKSILRYAPTSEIAQRFRDLAKEVVEGVGETEANFIYLSLERGREALLAGHRSEAHGHYRRATEEDPSLAEGWLGRAESAAEWDEEIGSWAQAAHLQPTNELARAGLDRALGQIASRSADDVSRLVTLGYFVSGLGDIESARRILKRALDLDPSHVQAGLAMAENTSDPREALDRVRRLHQSHPDKPEILAALENGQQRVRDEAKRLASDAAENARAGDMIRAADLFRQATELDPLNDEAWLGRGQTSRDWRQAFEFARRALEINPDNVGAQKLYRMTWMPEHDKRESLFGRVRRVLLGFAAVLVLISAVATLFLIVR